jgi:hypothetical protein
VQRLCEGRGRWLKAKAFSYSGALELEKRGEMPRRIGFSYEPKVESGEAGGAWTKNKESKVPQVKIAAV